MASGLSAPEALARLRAEGAYIDYRQIALIDAQGRTAGFSGAKTLGTHHIAEGADVVAAGNLLAAKLVPHAMVEAFIAASGPLGDRLVAALQAALAAGGEEGPVHSVGMLIVDTVAWPVADLRVDWHASDPIGALADLWELWKPQMEAYVTRALDPSTAPSYGVPGDE